MYLGTYRLSKMMEKSMAEKVSKKEKSTWMFCYKEEIYREHNKQ